VTDEQAKEIVELLKEIRDLLVSVRDGDYTVGVTVRGTVQVDGDVTVHDPR